VNLSWEETVFCAVDTETTGVNPEDGDRIIEVAMVPIFKGRLILNKAFATLVNPNIGISYGSQKVHKIGVELLERAPSMREVFPKVRYYLKNMIAVFHNGNFDLTFLDFAAKEVGELPIDVTYLDTQDMASEIFGEKKSLEWLAKKFSLTDRINHRALDDAIVTAKVFLKLAKNLGWENLGKFLKKWKGSTI